jgi:hypothetical protein
MKVDQSHKTKNSSAFNNAKQSGTLQRKVSSLDELQLLADSSSQITQLKTLKNQINKKADLVQLKKTETSDKKGLPEQLETGVEQLSGLDMGDVKVNYNSSKPSEIGAAAYAQGTDIHLGKGQEKHLPHEAWHVVQQKKGAVKATGTINGTSVNEERNLENEADQMGIKAQDVGNNAASIVQKVSLNVKDNRIIQKQEPETIVESTPETTPEVAPNLALMEKLVKYEGLVEMAKNAQSIINDADIWSSILNGTDVMGTVETIAGIAGASTTSGAIISQSINGADKIAGDISASVGSSITTLFQLISSIRILYNGFKGKDPMAIATGSKEFVAAVKSGLMTANTIMKATSGVVNPAIAAAIPGLGIVVSAADIMINLSNALNASQAQADMTFISSSYREGLTTSLGGKPEKVATNLFQIESRGIVFHKEYYLRLKPGILKRLEEIDSSDQKETEFDAFKTANKLPDTLNFSNFYIAVRTYELGNKLQEINQKRKVHGGNQIFTSLISIGGDIATFFPADGGITAVTLKGTSAAITGGLAAGKFAQQKSRDKGLFGGDTTRSTENKHQEYIQSAKSIYHILAQSGMKDKDESTLKTSDIDKIIPVQSMISATGASPESVYKTNYEDKKSKTDQVKLLVESMKKGRG